MQGNWNSYIFPVEVKIGIITVENFLTVFIMVYPITQ